MLWRVLVICFICFGLSDFALVYFFILLFYFISFFYFFMCLILCCVFAARAGLVAGSGPPAVSLRRLRCLAVVLVACGASVAGSFGSCRACGQLSASSGWF